MAESINDVDLYEPDDTWKQKDEFDSSMSPTEVAQWLQRKNIPYEFCQLFEENFIDGTEFVQLTPDEVKAMCPLGIAKKIIRMIPIQFEAEHPPLLVPAPTPSPSDVSNTTITTVTGAKSTSDIIPQSPGSSLSAGSSSLSLGASASVISSPSHSVSGLCEIPKLWRPDVNMCIENKVLTDGVRDEIVRRLVDILFSKSQKPTRNDCIELARKLLLIYPWMKDDAGGLGPSYSTWVQKMTQRIGNVIKKSRKRARSLEETENPKPKKSKRNAKGQLHRRYPVKKNEAVMFCDDPQSIEGHLKGLENEMKKAKPRDSLLLPLMKSTFSLRRDWIIDDIETVAVILKRYPALSRLAIIEQELDLIIGNPTKSKFTENWSTRYVPAILSYSLQSTKVNVKKLTDGIEEIGQEEKEKCALKALYECWKARNQANSLKFFYENFEMDTRPIEELSSLAPVRNSPRIIEVLDNEGAPVYNIVCEQNCFCKAHTFRDALYFCFATYYIFNLEYPKQISNLLCFFQDCILSYPDSLDRSTNFVTIVTDINKHVSR